jgi:hypothetical protein
MQKSSWLEEASWDGPREDIEPARSGKGRQEGEDKEGEEVSSLADLSRPHKKRKAEKPIVVRRDRPSKTIDEERKVELRHSSFEVVVQAAVGCAERFRDLQLNMEPLPAGTLDHDFNAQRTRFSIWYCSFVAEDSPTRLHSVAGETQDVLCSLLRRLLRHLEANVEQSFVQPLDQEESSSDHSCIIDSDAESLGRCEDVDQDEDVDQGEDVESRWPHGTFLQVIDRIISQLYRLSNLQSHLRQDSPPRTWSEIDFDAALQSNIKGHYFSLPEGAILRERLSERAKSSLSSIEDKKDKRTVDVLEMVQTPSDEMIKRWDSLTFPKLLERTGRSNRCPFCASRLPDLLVTQVNLWK